MNTRLVSARRIFKSKLRSQLHQLIFLDDSLNGKMFDTAILSLIVLSVIVVMLHSVYEIEQMYGTYLLAIEMFVTFVFVLEYLARLFSHRYPLNFLFSAQGLIDFAAIASSYFLWVAVGSNFLLLIRVFRILTIFRVFDLKQYTGQANELTEALKASRIKIIVFIVGVAVVVVVIGFLMYLVEGDKNNGFSSIPKSIYWAVVTLTTVGYGDIAPVTIWGRALATIVMLLGYGVLAVPTGIVSAEMGKSHGDHHPEEEEDRMCIVCGTTGHTPDAHFCRQCGARL
ncbi:MAG: ion transporter [Bacteroidota bacterium]